MVNQTIAKRAVELLNEMLKLDPEATAKLVDTRVSCNPALAHHPTVQVALRNRGNAPPIPMLGILGVLNGMAGALDEGPKKGWGTVTAVYDNDTGALQRFSLQEDLKPEDLSPTDRGSV